MRCCYKKYEWFPCIDRLDNAVLIRRSTRLMAFAVRRVVVVASCFCPGSLGTWLIRQLHFFSDFLVVCMFSLRKS